MSKRRVNARAKGARGERAWRDELREAGFQARRGQQFSGSPESPDVVCDDLWWMHFEVKCVEQVRIEDWMDQARRDAGGAMPIVAHKRRHRRWLVTMEAKDFFRLVREVAPPPGDGAPAGEAAGHRSPTEAAGHCGPTGELGGMQKVECRVQKEG